MPYEGVTTNRVTLHQGLGFGSDTEDEDDYEDDEVAIILAWAAMWRASHKKTEGKYHLVPWILAQA